MAAGPEGDLEAFELTNMAMALLIYPDDASKRERFEAKLNQTVAARLAEPGRGEESPSLGAPALTHENDLIPSRERNRLNQRMRVARMFRAHVKEKIEGALPTLPSGLDRYSINALSRYVSHDDKDGGQNFDKRWLKPTLPVLHLAIAFDLISTLRFGPMQAIAFSIHDEEFIVSVLQTAVWLEPFAINNPICNADPARLILLRPF